MIALKYFATVRPLSDAFYEACFDRIFVQIGTFRVVILIRTDAVMKRSMLPSERGVLQDAGNASLPNFYPVVEVEWLFSWLSEEM
jgi:hypothetical protein